MDLTVRLRSRGVQLVPRAPARGAPLQLPFIPGGSTAGGGAFERRSSAEETRDPAEFLTAFPRETCHDWETGGGGGSEAANHMLPPISAALLSNLEDPCELSPVEPMFSG
ncbi:hypothetical protein SKAU_G00395790 [Synaphobranchus kaupii]|uniref:Uncharacterized protein n=1 Tax=Synaphobranchus kaupii TaxID=118154 RepID=A0A9Q1ECF5_SYNKA|nr:hypothetical protein SKAU_G00395790 [Synaphobranchus kaupii]